MEQFLALARKWRPTQLADLVGQDPIVRALNNAVRLHRVHHAILLTGLRGVGKTSIARIFAKLLRCENLVEKNGLSEVCNACANCLEIARGASLDVLEIDGASNNGVDSVRELRENAKFLPSSGKRKITIIDEVHMLSNAAFNALLKILEEPPAHLFFVFATTDPQKLPLTILSRCQRFDLRSVSRPLIQKLLETILASENLTYESAAIERIAQSAGGSIRDALSLLDQVSLFSGAASGNKITLKAVTESLGTVDPERVERLIEAVFTRNRDALQLEIGALTPLNVDYKILAQDSFEYLYRILMKRSGMASETLPDWIEQRAVGECDQLFKLFLETLEWLPKSSHPDFVFHALLLRALHYAPAQLNVAPAVSAASMETKAPTAAKKTESEELAESLIPTSAFSTNGAPPVERAPKTFSDFLAFLRTRKPFLAVLLEYTSPKESTGGKKDFTLLIRPEHASTKRQLEAKIHQEALLQAVKEFYGISVLPKFEVSDQIESTGDSRLRNEAREREEVRHQTLDHPVIREASRLFGVDATLEEDPE